MGAGVMLIKSAPTSGGNFSDRRELVPRARRAHLSVIVHGGGLEIGAREMRGLLGTLPTFQLTNRQRPRDVNEQ